MKIGDIPTPALVVDAAMLRRNLELMATSARQYGVRLRPHFKAHKCVPLARLQLQHGAVGICAATENEARLLVQSGVKNVLLTSPLADEAKARRVAALAEQDDGFSVVVDHPTQVAMFESAGRQLQVMVDLDVGDHRTGIQPGEPAVQLAQQIVRSPKLRFAGLQGYSVRASHTEAAERAQVSANALADVQRTRTMLESAGIPVPLTTGASTATYLVDAEARSLDELQAGSYVFMDIAYRRIGGVAFENAATVLATVISANHPDRVTVDAGFKAFATDRPFGPELQDRSDLNYRWAGDEFGYVSSNDGSRLPRLGDRLRFLPPHCDPTVNLYDRIYVCDGEEVTEIWPVMERTSSSASSHSAR